MEFYESTLRTSRLSDHPGVRNTAKSNWPPACVPFKQPNSTLHHLLLNESVTLYSIGPQVAQQPTLPADGSSCGPIATGQRAPSGGAATARPSVLSHRMNSGLLLDIRTRLITGSPPVVHLLRRGDIRYRNSQSVASRPPLVHGLPPRVRTCQLLRHIWTWPYAKPVPRFIEAIATETDAVSRPSARVATQTPGQARHPIVPPMEFRLRCTARPIHRETEAAIEHTRQLSGEFRVHDRRRRTG